MATVHGSNFSETLNGTNVQDFIYAYGGNDVIYAYNGNDYVDGGYGNDTIVGGLGSDGLTGGPGADVFKYNSAAETTGDAIWDYKWWEGDKIDLRGIDAKESVWWNPTTWGDQAFSWKGNVATKALYAGELGYVHSGGNTYVYGNTDGDGTYEVNLKVAGVVHFIASDFML